MRQGCIVWPLLFLVAMNWVMTRVDELGNRAIVWDLTARLKDLEFTDDVAFLANTKQDIQVRGEHLSRVTRTIGLQISANKSKIMSLQINDKLTLMN